MDVRGFMKSMREACFLDEHFSKAKSRITRGKPHTSLLELNKKGHLSPRKKNTVYASEKLVGLKGDISLDICSLNLFPGNEKNNWKLWWFGLITGFGCDPLKMGNHPSKQVSDSQQVLFGFHASLGSKSGSSIQYVGFEGKPKGD